jgi:16S rRNA (adenine1518-N6/adenine1519-N6)-dimethyltransferase
LAIRSLFFHRRKFLRSVVLSAFKGRLDKPEVDEVLAELGLGETARAEELDVPMLLRVSDALRLKLAAKRSEQEPE